MESLIFEKLKTQLKRIREKMSTFDAYFSKGLELYEEKRYKLAIEFFKIALSQSNAEDYANYNLALAYQQINNEDEALKYYEKFLQKYPKDQSSLYNTALIYYNKEDYKQASKYFFESFRQLQDKDNITSLTKCYIKMENISKIIDLVEYIFNSNCKNDCAFEVAQIIEQGYAIKNPELLDFALEIYLKLYKEDETNFDAALAIAIVYAKKGDWSNAINYCEKALELNPKSFEANNQMGLIYYCAEEMDSCIYYYKKAFKLNSKTDYRIYSNLAYAYEKIGRIQDAIDLFKELITKFSNFPSKEEIKNHTKLLIEQNRENNSCL